MHIFVFRDAIPRKNDETIKLNIEGSELHFFHNEKELIIDTSCLRDGSSTMLMHNTLTGEDYVLYNFREILQILGMKPTEMLSALHQIGYMQVDVCNGDAFVKVFLLQGDMTLASDTTDFSAYCHLLKEQIHPLDYAWSYDVKPISAHLEGQDIDIGVVFTKSPFWKRDVYLSHGGQYTKLKLGVNQIRFKFIPTEKMYIGGKNWRYPGRSFDPHALLGLGNKKSP